MKISISISLLMVAVAAILVMQGNRELAVLRLEQGKLITEAAGLGITSPNETRSQRPARPERAGKPASARQIALDLIRLTQHLAHTRETGALPDIAAEDKLLETLQQLRSLGTDSIKTVIEEILNDPTLTDELRAKLLTQAIDALAERDPHAALSLLIGDNNPFTDAKIRSERILESLTTWARMDSAAAVAWFRANPLPFIEKKSMMEALVVGAGRTDLKAAVDLIKELGVPITGVLGKITAELRDYAHRTEFMTLVRAELPADMIVMMALKFMAADIGKGPFDETIRWINENELNEQEIQWLLIGAANRADESEKPRWIDWINGRIPEGSRDEQIGKLVEAWTSHDHQATGAWVMSLPNGPTKLTAIGSFAQGVAFRDPLTATRWALTLPPGKQRNAALKTIYDIWRFADPATLPERDAMMKAHPVD